MLAVTLLAGVNDSLEHARALAEFVQPVRAETPRLIVDLIPYNPIDAADAFQRMIRPCFTAPAGFLPALADLRTPEEYLAVDILTTPPWPGLFDHNSPGGPIAVPMVIAHGTADTLIPIALSEQAVSRRSRRGETIQIIRLPGVGHDARDESAGYLMTWVRERFEGQGPTR